MMSAHADSNSPIASAPVVLDTLSLIAEHVLDAIITIDLHSRIQYVNPATQTIFGYSADELIGQPLTVLMPETHRESHRRGIERYVRTGERHVDWKAAMLPGRHKDGHILSLGISFAEYELGGQRMFIGVARDIAGPSKLIEDLRQAKKDAEKTEHTLSVLQDAKDRFLAIVSHELLSPLTPILAALDTMQREDHDCPPTTIDIIRRNVELEVRLISDLLDLTRLSKGKFQLRLETIDIHTLLAEVVATYSSELSARNLRTEVYLNATKHYVKGDPARLDQVFWNLIKNSIKFTPDGGCITIRSRDAEGHVHIEVSDTGIGIKPEMLSRIFEAFEQESHGQPHVPGYISGLGLGLTISKELVEAHHGTIQAASEGSQKGTTITIELPVTVEERPAEPPIRSARAARATLLSSGKMQTILLVDDQLDTMVTLSMLLSRRGYEVATARTTAEAIEIVKGLPVDLVISDILLPDGTGIEMLPRLRAIRNVPALAVSGLGAEDDRQRSLRAGFQAHITKPFDFDKLLAAIEQWIAPVEHPVSEEAVAVE